MQDSADERAGDAPKPNEHGLIEARHSAEDRVAVQRAADQLIREVGMQDHAVDRIGVVKRSAKRRVKPILHALGGDPEDNHPAADYRRQILVHYVAQAALRKRLRSAVVVEQDLIPLAAESELLEPTFAFVMNLESEIRSLRPIERGDHRLAETYIIAAGRLQHDALRREIGRRQRHPKSGVLGDAIIGEEQASPHLFIGVAEQARERGPTGNLAGPWAAGCPGVRNLSA